jgi:hypothetical protein
MKILTEGVVNSKAHEALHANAKIKEVVSEFWPDFKIT